ncbi:MAG: sensor histidine kinase, partial [Deltaproteobacteria bacterium]
RMKSIEVTLERDPAVPAVVGDFDRLVQVITNLVGNAIQYSSERSPISVRIAPGEPLVRAKTVPRIEFEGAKAEPEPPEPPRPSAVVFIADRGPGIAEADLEKLFTPFFRGSRGGAAGTGLGLVISREIVRQHGGDIRVESKLAQGTRFTVVLPGAA